MFRARLSKSSGGLEQYQIFNLLPGGWRALWRPTLEGIRRRSIAYFGQGAEAVGRFGGSGAAGWRCRNPHPPRGKKPRLDR